MRHWNTFENGWEDVTDPNDPRYLSKTLAEHLAAIIGDSSSVQGNDLVGPAIETSCDTELVDLIVPDNPKGWICSVNFSDGTKEAPRLAVSTIQIIIKPDLSGIVLGSIKCW